MAGSAYKFFRCLNYRVGWQWLSRKSAGDGEKWHSFGLDVELCGVGVELLVLFTLQHWSVLPLSTLCGL